jgi:F1F0 ATPase subunit 2
MLIFSFAFGSLMGLLYFSGLWQTVRRLADSPRPMRLLMLSSIGRTVLAVGGFYLIMDGSWERLAAAMLGFLIVRAFLLENLGRVPKGATTWK